ncbi:MAG: hypothetical protein GX682_02550 [Clostridiaceae bacterium]|nr:hypothetical protein [Clostridiaceae bacterium]
MIKEKIQKIKDILKIKDGEDNKKKIENLVIFIVILIITIIMINTIWNKDNKNNEKVLTDTDKILAKTDTNKITDTSGNNNESNNELEEKLKNILKKIDGVGNVEVLITYSESNQILAMYNEDNTKNDTEEKDTRRRK